MECFVKENLANTRTGWYDEVRLGAVLLAVSRHVVTLPTTRPLFALVHRPPRLSSLAWEIKTSVSVLSGARRTGGVNRARLRRS